MPKERVRSWSTNRARASPYRPCSLSVTGLKSEKSSLTVGDEREWEEARCPICMEHPHNAVLLLCTSTEKGCRPYMCDTSYRHSNCLDQFCKSFAAPQSALGATSSDRGRMDQTIHATHIRSLGNQPLACPLCRGQIRGCIVIEAARRFMNSMPRSCSLETCNFVGTYIELRKHAREEHPSRHPSETDPRRESEWTRLQHQTNVDDTLSAYQSLFGDDSSDNDYYLSGSPFPYSDFFEMFDIVSSEAEDESIDYEVLEREFPFSFLYDESPTN